MSKHKKNGGSSNGDTATAEGELTRRKITPEVFVRAWQRSESPEAAAKILDKTVTQVKIRAYSLRKKGVALKSFPRRNGQRLDIAALNKIAQEALSPANPPTRQS